MLIRFDAAAWWLRFYLLCAVTWQGVSQVCTEGTLPHSSFSRQHKNLVFDCWQLFSYLCYSWRKDHRKNALRWVAAQDTYGIWDNIGWHKVTTLSCKIWIHLDHESLNLYILTMRIKLTQYEDDVVLPGSGALVAPEAQIFWFGQPWHGEAFPASSLFVPGQSKRIKQRSVINVLALLYPLKLIRKKHDMLWCQNQICIFDILNPTASSDGMSFQNMLCSQTLIKYKICY